VHHAGIIRHTCLGTIPSVLCDVISAVAEFMVRSRIAILIIIRHTCLGTIPSVLCDVTSVVTEFMVRMRTAPHV
jgi:hypothetical protein